MKLLHSIAFLLLLVILTAASDSSPVSDSDYQGDQRTDTLSPGDLQLLKNIASIRNDLIRVERKRMEQLSLANQQKAAGIIGAILDRAEQHILGQLPQGRFEWSWTGFEDPEGMIKSARNFLNTLAGEEDPFEGKFAEPGGYVVDHAIIKKEDLWHLVYIRGIAATNWPEYPLSNFGHAVTSNLKDWRIEKPVLETDDSGFDSYQVWAPHIIKHNNQYWMFYTGVNDSVSQTICLATSRDLYHWERHDSNPLINSLPWGHWKDSHWSDCRDPMILKDGERFYCYYTAGRKLPGSEDYEYCLGISSSTDLLQWKDEGFRRLKHTLDTPPESPFVVKKDGLFYLFYTNYKHGIVYLTSPDPLKGWKENPDDPQSILQGVSATEIFQEGNQWFITLISHMPNGLHFLEIKELIWNADGSISVQDPNPT